jgi:alkanesulfonate monooxygenase SsuD/methylene tetrahydromethanopterin reductase-like flavin-dependent oxidoreductase (luciferase family)
MRFGMGFIYPNYTDWDRFLALEQGASPEDVGPMQISDAQVLEDQMYLADLVEPLGLDTLWAFEQHAAPYIMIPDPNQYLSWIAGRTKRIDVGSMIVVLTWHNPFRVAEQISMLQHHLKGRYYFMGIGRGLARRNFDAMNVNIDESRERFWEIYEIVKLAFTQEMFSFEGQFYSYKNASLRPRPLDPKIVTDAWGTWTSETSLREMAQHGLQPMTTPNKTLESYIHDMQLFDQIRDENGYEPARRPILQVPLYCSETANSPEEQELVRQWIGAYVDSVLKMYELGTSNFAPGKSYAEYRTKGSDFGSGTYEDALETLTTKFLRDGIIGTPEECAERVAEHRGTINPSELVVLNGVGTMPVDVAEKSMRLYCEKVVPRFDDIRVRAEDDAFTGRGDVDMSANGAGPGRSEEKVAATGHLELPSV